MIRRVTNQKNGMESSMTTRRRLCIGWICLAMTGLENSRLQAQESVDKQATVIQVSEPKSNRSSDDDPDDRTPISRPQEFRIRSIEQRIEIIKEMMRKKEAEAAAAAAPESNAVNKPAPHAVDPLVTPDSKKLVDDEHAHGESDAHSILPEGSDAHSKLPEAPDSQSHPNPAKNPLDEIDIQTSPLNSLELANSLFITGHYAQASRGYEALLANKEITTLDQDWLRCLAANAYRVQGKVAAAEKLYREVVASKVKSYASDQAKWFLDLLERKKKLRSELDALEGELQAVQNKRSMQEK